MVTSGALRRKETNMETKNVPQSQRLHIFVMLIFIGGFLAGFTHEYRGGVLSNAQTGNMIIMAISLAKKNYVRAGYCIVSFFAYSLGAFLSELAASKAPRTGRFRWETVLVGLETMTILALSFIPDDWSFILTQVPINIIAAMQYNTFKSARGIGMATTFCTNHVRNFGVSLEKLMETGDRSFLRRALSHIGMIASFCVGVAAATLMGQTMGSKCLLLPAGVFALVLLQLAADDLERLKIGLYTN